MTTPPASNLLGIALLDMARHGHKVSQFTSGGDVWEVRVVPRGYQVTLVVASDPIDAIENEPLPFPGS